MTTNPKRPVCGHCIDVANAIIASGLAVGGDLEHHALAVVKLCALQGRPIGEAVHLLMAITRHMDISGTSTQPSPQPAVPN